MPPAVVATQQWYVGPRTNRPIWWQRGYNQSYEDVPLRQDQTGPSDGYRPVSTSATSSASETGFDGMWGVETACLLPAASSNRSEGFDETVSLCPVADTPNLDLYERLGASP
jgi:hypothetical protein